MRGGIPIGKLFGIALRLNYSWFIVFGLVTWSLAFDYFPSMYSSWSPATRITAGLLTSLLLFASLMAHELMHSVVAQKAGIPVKSITLFVFGGVSEITKEPEKPKDELRIALAGPLTSLVIGGIFWFIWLGARSTSDVIGAIAFWLGWTNVVLAVFNLIPGFPLDGGRVLRAILWWQRRDLRTATRIASSVGRGVGYVFIFSGIWLIFQGNWFNGLWLALIGWFMENAAAGSYRQVALQYMLQGHTTNEVLTRECSIVSPELTIQQLVNEQILATGGRCFPVVADNRALGLITLHDVRAIPRDLWSTKKVSEAMTPLDKMASVSPQEDLATVLQILTEKDINQVPVVEDGRIVGMVGRDNLLAFVKVRADLGM
ncbi:MAG: site-2 protease family protein [Dehalococcoidales bacterium]|nr:site-2 protease family protein [Dehalococcoidales bacterium]